MPKQPLFSWEHAVKEFGAVFNAAGSWMKKKSNKTHFNMVAGLPSQAFHSNYQATTAILIHHVTVATSAFWYYSNEIRNVLTRWTMTKNKFV